MKLLKTATCTSLLSMSLLGNILISASPTFAQETHALPDTETTSATSTRGCPVVLYEGPGINVIVVADYQVLVKTYDSKGNLVSKLYYSYSQTCAQSAGNRQR